MTDVRPYLGIARAPFLLLPFVLVAAGAGAAAYEGRFSWLASGLAVIGLLLLHAAVNALNEASDMRRGIDTMTERTPFSGGSGTLPAGLLTPRAAHAFGLACAALGGLIGLYFLPRVGWPMVPVLVFGAAAVLFYTDVFARAGVGELFAGLGLGLLPVWGASLVQGGRPGLASLAASWPAFFMTFNLLLLNEFPDEPADRKGGRRNLVLLLGRPAAARIYTLAALAVPTWLIVAVALRFLPPLALVAVLPSIFLVKPVAWALTKPQEPVPIPALAANVVWNLATNALLAVALFVAARG